MIMGKVKKIGKTPTKKPGGVGALTPRAPTVTSPAAPVTSLPVVGVPLFPAQDLFKAGEWGGVAPSLNRYRHEDVVTLTTNKKAVKAEYRKVFNKKQRKRLEHNNFHKKIRDLEEEQIKKKKKKKSKILAHIPAKLEPTVDKDKVLPSPDKPKEKPLKPGKMPTLKQRQNQMDLNIAAFKNVISSSEFKQDPFAAITSQLQIHAPSQKPRQPQKQSQPLQQHAPRNKPVKARNAYKPQPAKQTIHKPHKLQQRLKAAKTFPNQRTPINKRAPISAILQDKANNIKRLSKKKNS